MLEKLIWICAFMLVGARHGGCTVGEVEAEVGAGGRAVGGGEWAPAGTCRLRPECRSASFFGTSGHAAALPGCSTGATCAS